MKTTMHILLVLPFLMFSPILSYVKIDYEITEYTNYDAKDSDGRLCDGYALFYHGYCDPEFELTASAFDGRGNIIGSILKATKAYSGTPVVYNVLQASDIYPEFVDKLKIELDIHDIDPIGKHRMGAFSWSSIILQTGTFAFVYKSYFRVHIRINLECATDFYGRRCDVHCKPRPGLWKCNHDTGIRECAKWCWHGNCHLTTANALCICNDGWIGENCDTEIETTMPQTSTSSINPGVDYAYQLAQDQVNNSELGPPPRNQEIEQAPGHLMPNATINHHDSTDSMPNSTLGIPTSDDYTITPVEMEDGIENEVTEPALEHLVQDVTSVIPTSDESKRTPLKLDDGITDRERRLTEIIQRLYQRMNRYDLNFP